MIILLLSIKGMGTEEPEDFVVTFNFAHIREELFEKRVFGALRHRLPQSVPSVCASLALPLFVCILPVDACLRWLLRMYICTIPKPTPRISIVPKIPL